MPKGSAIEQEIIQLEKQLQEKKAALGQQTERKDTIPSEKEILRQVVGEKIQQQMPQFKISSQGSSPTDDNLPSYLDPQLKDKIQGFINVTFAQSLEHGIKEAIRSDNPAILDAFHDVLVDELYNALLERKKIEPVK